MVMRWAWPWVAAAGWSAWPRSTWGAAPSCGGGGSSSSRSFEDPRVLRVILSFEKGEDEKRGSERERAPRTSVSLSVCVYLSLESRPPDLDGFCICGCPDWGLVERCP
eukprot:3928663-Prymnesium_polylepis.1